jgi:hypothetical protein
MRSEKDLQGALKVSVAALEAAKRAVHVAIESEAWDVVSLQAQGVIRISARIRDLEWILGLRDRRSVR